LLLPFPAHSYSYCFNFTCFICSLLHITFSHISLRIRLVTGMACKGRLIIINSLNILLNLYFWIFECHLNLYSFFISSGVRCEISFSLVTYFLFFLVGVEWNFLFIVCLYFISIEPNIKFIFFLYFGHTFSAYKQ